MTILKEGNIKCVFSGAFTPLTMQGSIVVDGVLASCYAYENHDLAHMTMAPIRWFPELLEWLLGEEDLSPGYIKIAINFGNLVSPYDSMY